MIAFLISKIESSKERGGFLMRGDGLTVRGIKWQEGVCLSRHPFSLWAKLQKTLSMSVNAAQYLNSNQFNATDKQNIAAGHCTV